MAVEDSGKKMPQHVHTVAGMQALPQIARDLLSAYPDRRIFAFYGEMGAGKTTFIKAICRELGVTEMTMSPTFAIVNAYTSLNQEPVYHMDFYRIKTIEEVYDIGYEEYFYSGHYCFLEWPQLITPLLPDTTVKVWISGDDQREIRF